MGLSDAAPPAWAPRVARAASPGSTVSLASPAAASSAPSVSAAAALDASPAPRASAARRARSCIARLFSAKYSSSRITCVSSSYANAHGSPPGPRCHRVFSNAVRDGSEASDVFFRGAPRIGERAESNSVLSAVPSIAVPSIAVPSIVSSTEYAPPRLYAPTHSVTLSRASPDRRTPRLAAAPRGELAGFVAHPRAVSSSTRSNTRSTSASYAARAKRAALAACLRSERYRTTRAGVARRRRHRPPWHPRPGTSPSREDERPPHPSWPRGVDLGVAARPGSRARRSRAMARGATRAHARPRLDSARNRALRKRRHTLRKETSPKKIMYCPSSVPACCYFSLSVSPRAQSDRRPAPTDTRARPSRRLSRVRAHAFDPRAFARFTRAAPAVPRCLGKINTTSGCARDAAAATATRQI